MKITNGQLHQVQALKQKNDTKNIPKNEKFSNFLEQPEQPEEKKNSEVALGDIVTDDEVSSFLHKLTSMGASAFWFNFNLEKIQEKIEKKREELLEEMGLDEMDDVQKASKEVQEALKEIEAILQDYAKELMEQIKAKDELEKSQKRTSILASLLTQSTS